VDDLLIKRAGSRSPHGAECGHLVRAGGSASPPAAIALASPPSSVRRVEGAHEDDQAFVIFGSGIYNVSFGGLAALPGDLDADGSGDLAIGSQFADPGGSSSGIVNVIRGGAALPAVLSLASPRAQDAAIGGEAASDIAGRGLAGAGDFNDDGVPDLVIGAPQANPLGRSDAGTVTVLFGSAYWPGVFALPDIEPFGLRMIGALGGDLAGLAAAGLGDWSGDGIDDLAVSSPGASAGAGRSGGGVVTVLLGRSLPIVFTSAETWPLYR